MMFFQVREFLTLILVVSSLNSVHSIRDGRRRPEPQTYRLCTSDDISHAKCVDLVDTAEDSSIDLPLECVKKESYQACVTSVASSESDFLVAEGHGYQEARTAQLRPVIFERQNDENVYIVVVPRNITYVQLLTGPIDVDQSKDRAFHAGAFFNMKRFHNICANWRSIDFSPSIRIVNSAEYVPNSDDILICPNLSYAEVSDFKRCNFEAEPQRAIFIRRSSKKSVRRKLQNIVRTIFDRFGPDAEHVEGLNSKNFNFFTTYNDEDDVIFSNNAIGFDLTPTYPNGVNEKMFSSLHCDTEEHSHNPAILE